MTTWTPDPVHGDEAARWGGWQWREPMRGEHFHRCSYCGSISPDDLAAEPVWRAEWADRKYGWPHKFYVDIPNRDPGGLFAITTLHQASEGPYAPGGESYRPPDPGLIAWGDLTGEQLAIAKRDGHDGVINKPPDYIGFGTRAVHHAKFYTVHLADPALPEATRTRIECVSGLRFEFTDDGRVSWYLSQEKAFGEVRFDAD